MKAAAPTMPMPIKKRSAHAVPPPGIDRIVLTGFMGSGKTTIGSLLAERLGWAFLDLDREIERSDGRTVPQIFSETSEAHFRRLESAALASLLSHRHAVIALGGGAPEEPGNCILLEQAPRTAVVYLAAPFHTLVDRCIRQAEAPAPGERSTARPVLADLASAEHRFHLRRAIYQRIASHTLDTSTLTPGEASAAILDLLNQTT